MSSPMDDIPTNGDTTYRVTATELRGFCERIERLEAEKKELAEQQKGVKAEARVRGYDLKALGEMLKLRKLDADVRSEREAIRTLYAEALEIFD